MTAAIGSLVEFYTCHSYKPEFQTWMTREFGILVSREKQNLLIKCGKFTYSAVESDIIRVVKDQAVQS